MEFMLTKQRPIPENACRYRIKYEVSQPGEEKFLENVIIDRWERELQ